MPRIVSLIASATEIVCALGFEKDLVGRSHECDYPESVRHLPTLSQPAFAVNGRGVDIDTNVKDRLRAGLSIYQVDEEKLQTLAPDVIVTQSQCAVCAVSEEDVQNALCSWVSSRPRVVTLEPNALGDIWRDIERVAEALGVPKRGQTLVAELQARMADVAAKAARLPRKRVACIEWIEPLMAAGNWVPELVEMAGGVNLFGTAGKHSPWMTFEQLAERDPDVIVAMPCGFDLERTRQEMGVLAGRAEWEGLRAVREKQVFLTDGNQYFNRPGPRVVESLEILAEILHPEAFHFGHEGSGWSLPS
jgi:iron complex transport system substrate-binding protein